MSVKSVWRTHYQNGFRVNQELGMPYHLYCGLKATLMALPYQFPRTKLVVVGASFRQLIVAILLLQF